MKHSDSGENVFWAGRLRSADRKDEHGNWIYENSFQTVTPKDVVDSWGNEKQWYDHDNTSVMPGRQVLWP